MPVRRYVAWACIVAAAACTLDDAVVGSRNATAGQGDATTGHDGPTNPCAESLPAFPGAVGHGTDTPGGRGGRVLEVTQLGDDGPGSLREALNTTGARIIVFRVGGTITLREGIYLNEPYVTIAGQTAPGGGIALRMDPASSTEGPLWIATHDVVVRYVRFRPGPSDELGCCRNGIDAVGGASDVVIDHCSISWAVDELITSWYNASRVTVQWSLLTEPLYMSSHESGPNGSGISFGHEVTAHTFHHNLMAHAVKRAPSMSSITDAHFEVSHNVIYNWAETGATFTGRGRVDLVSNTFVPGPNTPAEPFEVGVYDEVSMYAMGNIGPHRSANDDEWALVGTGASQAEVAPDTFRSSEPLGTLHVPEQTADEAYAAVLANAGANLPERDSVDQRIIAEVQTLDGIVVDDPSQVGGWPILAEGEAPVDTDHDGMPDTWEQTFDLDASDPSDGPKDADGDGYTNVEEHLNGTDPRVPCA